MEEPGGLQSTGSQRVGHDWTRLNDFTFTFIPAQRTGRSLRPEVIKKASWRRLWGGLEVGLELRLDLNSCYT